MKRNVGEHAAAVGAMKEPLRSPSGFSHRGERRDRLGGDRDVGTTAKEGGWAYRRDRSAHYGPAVTTRRKGVSHSRDRTKPIRIDALRLCRGRNHIRAPRHAGARPRANLHVTRFVEGRDYEIELATRPVATTFAPIGRAVDGAREKRRDPQQLPSRQRTLTEKYAGYREQGADRFESAVYRARRRNGRRRLGCEA